MNMAGANGPDWGALGARRYIHRAVEASLRRLGTDYLDLDQVQALQAYADARGRSLLDVAIGGLAAKPTVASVIAGATTPEQVAANVAAGAWLPGAEDLAELDALR